MFGGAVLVSCLLPKARILRSSLKRFLLGGGLVTVGIATLPITNWLVASSVSVSTIGTVFYDLQFMQFVLTLVFLVCLATLALALFAVQYAWCAAPKKQNEETRAT